MSDERLAEILQYIRRYGSANGWTGTIGQACCYIHELLAEVERLRTEIEWYRNDKGA